VDPDPNPQIPRNHEPSNLSYLIGKNENLGLGLEKSLVYVNAKNVTTPNLSTRSRSISLSIMIFAEVTNGSYLLAILIDNDVRFCVIRSRFS